MLFNDLRLKLLIKNLNSCRMSPDMTFHLLLRSVFIVLLSFVLFHLAKATIYQFNQSVTLMANRMKK